MTDSSNLGHAGALLLWRAPSRLCSWSRSPIVCIFVGARRWCCPLFSPEVGGSRPSPAIAFGVSDAGTEVS